MNFGIINRAINSGINNDIRDGKILDVRILAIKVTKSNNDK